MIIEVLGHGGENRVKDQHWRGWGAQDWDSVAGDGDGGFAEGFADPDKRPARSAPRIEPSNTRRRKDPSPWSWKDEAVKDRCWAVPD